jgi:biopolymer transport protein ExbB
VRSSVDNMMPFLKSRLRLSGATGWCGLLALLFVVLAPRLAHADVQSAYQREFAFLEAEKNSLQQRIAALEAENQQKLATAQAEIDQLQGSVLGLSTHADRMTEMLTEVDREADAAGEDEDLVASLLTQAEAALDKGGVKLPEVAADDPNAELRQVAFAFDNAIKLLDRFSRVRKEQGEFFAPSGEKVSGTIIRLGRIGALGVSEQSAGPLAPAGADLLKIWPEPTAEAATREIANGGMPSTLRVFLFESLEKGIEKKEEKSAREIVDSGGIIGWVIVWAGLLAMLMAVARVFLLLRAAANTSKLGETITPLLERKKVDEAIEICRRAKSAGGRVLVATLKNLHRERDELEDIISEAILHEQPALDRFGSAIIVVAAVAPLLGLLGTVTGMIATFDIITEFGTGNPKLLSGGISIALVTTELGLIVAIPSLVIGNLLTGWAESIKDNIDKVALRAVNVASGVRISERPTAPPEPKGELTNQSPVPAE